MSGEVPQDEVLPQHHVRNSSENGAGFRAHWKSQQGERVMVTGKIHLGSKRGFAEVRRGPDTVSPPSPCSFLCHTGVTAATGKTHRKGAGK